MAQNELHVDMGVLLRITIEDENGAKDVSGATTKTLIIKKPDDSISTYSMNYYTDGTDGIVQYATVAGDLDQAGIYKYQTYLVISPYTYYSDVRQLRVFKNLDSESVCGS